MSEPIVPLSLPVRKSRSSRQSQEVWDASESAQQIATVEWAKWQVLPYASDTEPGAHVADYLFAVPNGGYRLKRAAGRLRAEGVKAGVSDLMLPLGRHGHHGLFLEMKRMQDGRETEEQRKWRERMVRAGYLAKVCWSASQAIELLSWYVGLSEA